MKEFLVELVTSFAPDMPAEEIDRLRAAEKVRARELAVRGRLVRLWRPIGELRSIGLWRAADEAELRSHVLGTLPLFPWMAATVTPIGPHPNDPGRSETEG